jgi:peptidoglycan hydrolase-like protein with peptidoglycan-binding domain
MLNEQMKAPPSGAESGTPNMKPPSSGAESGTPNLGNTQPVQKKPINNLPKNTDNPPKQRQDGTNSTSSLNKVFDERGLFYGMKHNKYVHDLQKFAFKFPPNLQTGNYLDKTKAAVRDFIQKNNITSVPADGSQVDYDLYFKLLNIKVDANGDPMYDAEGNLLFNDSNTNVQNSTQAAPIKDDTTTNSTPQNSGDKGTWDGSVPLKIGDKNPFVKRLRRVLNLPEDGALDQATIDAIKKFINNPKVKKLMVVDPVDGESLRLLNDANPQVDVLLYNTIMRTHDQLILHNRDNPEDIINEMSRMKFKLKRYFKK